jgi:hypothetical protein
MRAAGPDSTPGMTWLDCHVNGRSSHATSEGLLEKI